MCEVMQRVLLCCLVVLLSKGFRVATAQSAFLGNSTDESFLEALPFNETQFFDLPFNETSVEQLSQGKAVVGTVDYGQYDLIGFRVPKRESEDLGFPDVLLSLEVVSEEGNANLYCLPFIPANPRFTYPPHPGNREWHSNHSQGMDYVFLSSRDRIFGESAQAEFSKDTGIQQTVSFVCSIWGFSRIPTDYRLELDLDYTPRTLLEEERTAVRSIYDKCCLETGCPLWKAESVFVLGGDTEGELPVFDLCHVYGNVCDDDGHLIKLEMAKFNLECEFPSKEISGFSMIEKIELSHNKLTGNVAQIAADIKILKKLRRFSAVGNDINGSIADPQVCELASGGLEHLSLSHNRLDGPLPSCFFDNSTLTEIALSGNDLMSAIPPVFREDSRLEFLSISRAKLTGSIPAMANLTKLRHLDLHSNDLTGTFPADIGELPLLEFLGVEVNQLTGPIPDSLVKNPSLTAIYMNNNSFTQMPGDWNTVGAASNRLREVLIHFNSISGPLPAALLTSDVVVVSLEGNSFTGPLPVYDKLFPRAWLVLLGGNQITGTIPEEWSEIGLFNGTAAFLRIIPALILSNNLLSGDVPRFLLDPQGRPFQLVRFLGAHLDLGGNNFNCIELDSNTTIAHLQGLEACKQAPETVPVDAQGSPTIVESGSEEVGEPGVVASGLPADGATLAQNPADPNVRGDIALTQGIVDSQTPGSASSSLSIGAIVGVTATVVVLILVSIALVAVFIAWRKRSRARQESNGAAFEDNDAEMGHGVSVKFEKYNDDAVEVQMFNGKRSAPV